MDGRKPGEEQKSEPQKSRCHFVQPIPVLLIIAWPLLAKCKPISAHTNPMKEITCLQTVASGFLTAFVTALS
jgi:hypothetical protein